MNNVVSCANTIEYVLCRVILPKQALSAASPILMAAQLPAVVGADSFYYNAFSSAE
jgi:hypothetical protein